LLSDLSELLPLLLLLVLLVALVLLLLFVSSSSSSSYHDKIPSNFLPNEVNFGGEYAAYKENSVKAYSIYRLQITSSSGVVLLPGAAVPVANFDIFFPL
jgi:hypothetical protein